MTDKTDSKEREAFEAWASRSIGRVWRDTTPGCTDCYQDASTNIGWRAWQARASIAPSGFDAADMATAWSNGFRDGVASLAASAGSEPVAYAMFADNGNIRLWSKARIPHPDAKPLYLHPSPPEGMVGGWISVDERLPKCSRKLYSSGVEVLIWPPHDDGSRTAFYGRRQSTKPSFYKYGSLLNHVQFWADIPPPPTSSADSRKGE